MPRVDRGIEDRDQHPLAFRQRMRFRQAQLRQEILQWIGGRRCRALLQEIEIVRLCAEHAGIGPQRPDDGADRAAIVDTQPRETVARQRKVLHVEARQAISARNVIDRACGGRGRNIEQHLVGNEAALAGGRHAEPAAPRRLPLLLLLLLLLAACCCFAAFF